MANYANLKAALTAAIHTNTQRAITGDILNAKMDEMINALGAGYQYMGGATPSTNPGSPDSNVVYLATTAGTYTNFGGLTLASGKIAFLRWNGTWAKDEISVQAELTIDSQPTSGSSNPVASGGVFTALQGKQQTISTVNVTVDNNTGTPSATASVSGGTMTMAFANLKGATGATGPQGPQGPQGNTGSSVDYPYELINNLTTDDATKGLSAAMGKQLRDLINTVAFNVQTIIDNLANIAYIGAVPGYEDMGVTSPTWTITTNLTNYTMAESISEVVRNHAYENTLVPDSGYDFGTAVITMGGVDITEDCFDAATGEISIAVVTGNIVISGVAERAATLDLAFNGIELSKTAGGYNWFCFRSPTKSLSPLIRCKGGDSITFSANVADANKGVLAFFNEDYEYITYYGAESNPRTVTLANDFSGKYMALSMLTTNFSNSYIVNNTTGDSWYGSTHPSNKIMDAEDFPTMSPLANNITFDNGDAVVIGWNGTNTKVINTTSIKDNYSPTMFTVIGINKEGNVPTTFLSPYIDISNLGLDSGGNHSLKIYGGGSSSGILRLLDDSNSYANFYSFQINERTVSVDPRYNKVQIFAPSTVIQDCYVKDALTDTVIWSGSSYNNQ